MTNPLEGRAWVLHIGGGFKLSAAVRVTEPARLPAVARTGVPAATATTGRRPSLLNGTRTGNRIAATSVG